MVGETATKSYGKQIQWDNNKTTHLLLDETQLLQKTRKKIITISNEIKEGMG